MTVYEMMGAFMEWVEGATSVSVGYGRPDVGRQSVVPPVGGIEFRSSDFVRVPQTHQTLGSVRPRGGKQVFALLVVHLSNEIELLQFVDAFLDATYGVAVLDVDGSKFKFDVGPATRPIDESGLVVGHVLEWEITFTYQ